MMGGVGCEIDRGQATGEKNLAVVAEFFFLPWQDGPGGEKSCAGEVKENDFAKGAEEADVVLIRVVAEKDHRGEDHDDPNTDEPVGAQTHFEGFAPGWFGWFGHFRRGGCGLENRFGNDDRWSLHRLWKW